MSNPSAFRAAARRQERGLTQESLGELVGYSAQMIAKIEDGKRFYMTFMGGSGGPNAGSVGVFDHTDHHGKQELYITFAVPGDDGNLRDAERVSRDEARAIMDGPKEQGRRRQFESDQLDQTGFERRKPALSQ
jgi:hypothetical protein